MPSTDEKLLRELVRRVSALEARTRRTTALSGVFGGIRPIGGFRAHGPSPTFTTTSATYVEVGGTDYTLRTLSKARDDTSLLIVFWLDGFATTSTILVQRGIAIGGTDYDSRNWRINALSQHTPISGHTVVDGVSAQAIDVRMKVRVSSGTGTLNIGTEDALGYIVYEVPSGLTFA